MRDHHSLVSSEAEESGTEGEREMKFKHGCTRYTEGGNCRLTGYACTIRRERDEKHIITAAREKCCYWFTSDPEEGKQMIDLTAIYAEPGEECTTEQGWRKRLR